MKTLHTHNSEIKEKMKSFWELTGDTPLDLERKQIDFITNQNKQLYIKIAEEELKRLTAELEIQYRA